MVVVGSPIPTPHAGSTKGIAFTKLSGCRGLAETLMSVVMFRLWSLLLITYLRCFPNSKNLSYLHAWVLFVKLDIWIYMLLLVDVNWFGPFIHEHELCVWYLNVMLICWSNPRWRRYVDHIRVDVVMFVYIRGGGHRGLPWYRDVKVARWK
jgi:hypothetical protein